MSGWNLIQTLMVGVSATFAIAAASAHQTAPASSQWVSITSGDVTAMHDLLLDNHPGSVDADADGETFRRWLAQGYTEAAERAKTASTYFDYRSTMMAYANGFHDAHVNWIPLLTEVRSSWPGFLVRAEGATVVVDQSELGNDAPSDGAQLIACDSRPAETLGLQILAPAYANWSLEARRAWSWPLLMVDDRNRYAVRPKTCTFMTASGATIVNLVWRPIPGTELAAKLDAARRIVKQVPTLNRFGRSGYWIALPSSATSGPDAEKLHQLIDAVSEQRDQIRAARSVAIDLRGNIGGTTEWADQVANAIWGEPYVAYQRRATLNPAVDWRSSPANIAQARLVVRAISEQFPSSPGAASVGRIADGMDDALKQGRAFYREAPDETPLGKVAPHKPVKGKVFLVTDGGCYSACLGIADLVVAMGGVTILGDPTSADTNYMQARSVALPSGLSSLWVASKVYRSRQRGSNVPYVPNVRWHGDIRDTTGLQRWVDEHSPLR